MTTTETQIKASDLRYGNLVKLSVKVPTASGELDWLSVNEIARVINIGGNEVATEINGVSQRNPYKNISPILITPEILEKAGFKKIQDYYSSRIDEYIWLHIYDDSRYGFWSDSMENEANFTLISQDNRIKYLHQLQNLYFALTQTELEIQL